MWPFIITFFTKHIWTLISVIADLLVIAFVGYSIWMVFHPKPTTTNNQRAEQIYNNNTKCTGLINFNCKPNK